MSETRRIHRQRPDGVAVSPSVGFLSGPRWVFKAGTDDNIARQASLRDHDLSGKM